MSEISKIRRQEKEKGFTQMMCPNCDSKGMRVFKKLSDDGTKVEIRIYCGNCLTCLH